MHAKGLVRQNVRAVASVPAETAAVALATAFQTTMKVASRRRRNTRTPGGSGPARWVRPTIRKETPVVLVPGYLSTTTCWEYLLGRLQRSGYRDTTCLQYNSLRAGIPEIAEVIAGEVSAAARRSVTRGVHVIGYSLGGLAVRYALQHLGAEAAALSAVTIATPHRGTPLARLGIGPAATQMRARSGLLDDLPPIASNGRVRWLLIGSTADRVVPVSSATADRHASSAIISAGGHVNIMNTPQLADAVIGHLASCRNERTTPQELAA